MQNIFLDFDGTLVDIKTRHYETYRQCVSRFNGNCLEADAYWSLKRHDTPWADILRRSALDSSIEKEFLTYFIECIEDFEMLKTDRLFGDALSFIDSINQSHEVYLVSLRRNHLNLVKQLEYLSIHHKFKEILSGHSETKKGVLTKKADVIRSIRGHEAGVIIGDTEADIAASHQLNITSIALTTGIRDRSLLEKLQPSYIVNSLSEAKRYI